MKKIQLAILAAAVLAFAASSYADELFYLSSKTVAPAGEKPIVTLEGRTGINYQIVFYRIDDPLAFAVAQKNMRRPDIEDTPARKWLNQAILDSTAKEKPTVVGNGKPGDIEPAADCRFTYSGFLAKSLTPSANSGEYAKETITIPVAEPGLYLVECAYQNRVGYTTVLVSNIAVLTKRSGQQLLAWVVDRKTGKPVEGADITVARPGETIATAKTDASGLASIKVPDLPEFLVFAKKGADFSDADPSYYPADVAGIVCYMYTDRPLYKPGETVEFKGIIRETAKGSFRMCDAADVKITAHDAQKNKIAETTAKTGEYGTFSGKFVLPAEMRLGKCILVAESLGKSFGAEFTAEEFKKPEFEVKCTSDKTHVIGGGTVKVTVEGKYFFGAAVEGGQVHYIVNRSLFWRPIWREADYSWYFRDNEMKSFTPEKLSEGDLVLDNNGRVEIAIEAAKMESDYSISVVAYVRDKSGASVSGAAGFRVTRAAFDLAVKTDKLLYPREDQAKIEVKALDYSDNPIENVSVTIALFYVEGKDTLVPVGEKEGMCMVVTDNQGIAAQVFALTGKEGKYIIRATAKDANGNAISAERDIYVITEGATLAYTGDWLSTLPSKNKYFAGETARILVLAPEKDLAMLVTCEGAVLHEWRIVAEQGNARVIEIPVKPEYAPNFFVGVALVKNNALLETQAQIIVPPAEKFLKVAISMDKEAYKPGETGTLLVKATDNLGHPVKAELSIGVVDESLYVLRGEMTVPMEEFFYHLVRNNVSSASGMFHEVYGYGKVSSRFPAPVIITKIDKGKNGGEYENASGLIEPSAPMEAPERERFDRAMRQRDTAEHQRAGYEDAGPRGGTGAAMPRPAPAPELRDSEAEFSAITAEARDGISNYDSITDYADKAMGRESKPARTRADFKTTILWIAQVVTDEKGEAKAEVQFPDNLTRWRLTARAVTDDTRVAEVKSETATRIDILIRAAVPRFVRERDILDIPTISHNRLSREISANVSLKIDGLEKTAGADASAKIGPSGQFANDYRFKASFPGEAKFRAEILSKDGSDALEGNVSVLQHGVEKVSYLAGSVGPATGNLSITLPDGADLRTAYIKIYITGSVEDAISQALPYIIVYPYGCIEQTLEKFAPDAVAMDAFEKAGIEHPLKKELPAMVEKGMGLLIGHQHEDGGWGWYGETASNAHMTALVLRAIADASPRVTWTDAYNAMREKAIKYLVTELANNSGLDYETRALGANALASNDFPPAEYTVVEGDSLWTISAKLTGTGKNWERIYGDNKEIIGQPNAIKTGLKLKIPAAIIAESVLESAGRDKASSHTKALLATAFLKYGATDEAKMLAAEIEKDAVQYTAFASWGESGRQKWQNDEIEATAECLNALVLIKPESTVIRKAIDFLILKRLGDRWNSTRDTAAVVRAFSAYLSTTGATKNAVTITVILNGAEKKIALPAGEPRIDKLAIVFGALKTGENVLSINTPDKNVLYYAAYCRYMTTEENVEPSSGGGLEIYRTIAPAGNASADSWKIGDFVTIEIVVKSEKARQYVMVSDMLPSCVQVLDEKEQKDFVPMESRGGYSNWERRTDRTVFFYPELPAGETRIKYAVRVTHSGEFHAMPPVVEMMYFGDVRANGAENILAVGK
jgi:hypothetical protein